MIVYGDHIRCEPASSVSASVAQALGEVGRMSPGIDRHAALVSAFVRAGELVQGIADAEFEQRGCDAQSKAQEAGAAVLAAMAAAIDRSWQSGFTADPDTGHLVRRLNGLATAGFVRTRTGEGYAHYGLYPESYLAAARSSGLGPDTCVIGIRSVGVSLAALVACALGARVPFSVRPVGHPFDREIRAAPDLLAEADRLGDFAVVDEGPGLSGSSFASVAKWLVAQGVGMNRIHFFPSHDSEPGAMASPDTRRIWQRCARHPASSDAVLGASGGLQQWLAGRIGPLTRPLRQHSIAPSIPQDARFARSRFIADTRAGRWLVKFAGVGQSGRLKLLDAQALADACFGPQTVALCYGFLVQKWADGIPMTACRYDRGEFLKRLAAYLAFRVRRFGMAGPGASLGELRHMAIENSREALGAEAARQMEMRLADLETLSGRIHRVRTDNRLHAWEWLVTNDGFLKLDAVDHCCAHDLVGCQDIAWDLADGIAEHDLQADEIVLLGELLKREGIEVERELTSMLLPCYLAFQLGMWTTAEGAGPGNAGVAERYARKLSQALREAPL
ncbi:hypothetical protein [Mesorhizobium sp. SP-1A]|uniref:hypothetical protein n=1 Tax=Mesorhizobium sp. SP-1A TaxID=3077840 RepID=UPI0028F6D975|nr:hypothetical protein [Mesorhizobium sp. SP-1A]